MTARVFAFGSNMCSGRFRDYGVQPLGAGQAAILRGHRLVFDKGSVDGSGKANLHAAPGASVWGVLWEIPVSELKLLDDGEGGGYRRTMLEVATTSGQTVQAWVYLATAPDATGSLKPYTWYLRFLIEGAVEHQLPDDYIQELRQLSGDSDPDRNRDAKKRALSCGE